MSLLLYNLRKCGQMVVIEDRNIQIVNGRATEVFSNPRSVLGAIRTLRRNNQITLGYPIFDGTNTERFPTHSVCIEYIAGITSEMWIRKASSTDRWKILASENCCETDETIVLLVTARGDGDDAVNQA